jgi:predicted  nucleic acid-binding Zn-ribbon protein
MKKGFFSKPTPRPEDVHKLYQDKVTSLNRKWATKAEVEKLENQIVHLRLRLAELERDFTYLHKHHVEKNNG